MTVEIPQITNPEEAVQTLGTTAQLLFMDADGKEWLTGEDIAKASYGYGNFLPRMNERRKFILIDDLTDTGSYVFNHVVFKFLSHLQHLRQLYVHVFW